MKTLILLCAPLAACLSAFAQPSPDTLWSRVVAGPCMDFGMCVAQTSTGGYVIGGQTQEPDYGNRHSYMIMLSSTGRPVGARNLPMGNRMDAITDMYQLPNDSGFVACGLADTLGDLTFNGFVMRTDLTGQQQWAHRFGTFGDERPSSIIPSADGGYLIAGTYTPLGGAQPDKVLLVKVNGEGTFQWSRTYGGAGLDQGARIRPAGDDTYFIVGTTNSYGHGNFDIYLLKVNASGDTLWTRCYGGPNAEMGMDLMVLGDGGLLISGSTESFGHGGSDLYLVRTNSAGDTLWTSAIGGENDEDGGMLAAGPEGSFVLAGRSYSYGDQFGDLCLVGVDATGNELWHRTYGGDSYEWTDALARTADQGYIMVGNTLSFGAESNDIYVVKTGPHTTVDADVRTGILPSNFTLSAYPNPFNPVTTLAYSLPAASRVTVTVFDVNGREVRVLEDGIRTAGEHVTQFDGLGLSSGVYFGQIVAGEYSRTQKLVLMK
jgi:hypothetical protein